MNAKPLLYDLFCGAGGSSHGYQLAGFRVIGVDIKSQPRYRGDDFIRMDALEFLRDYQNGHFEEAAAFAPCQHASSLRHLHKEKKHLSLIEPTRKALEILKCPWVIENVNGANLKWPILLCGSMFDLGANCSDGRWHQLRRHRLFESNVRLLTLVCRHVGRPVGVYGNGGGNAERGHLPGINGFTGKASERRQALGIDWMTRYELSQAVPPPYCEFVGKQLMRVLDSRVNVPRMGSGGHGGSSGEAAH